MMQRAVGDYAGRKDPSLLTIVAVVAVMLVSAAALLVTWAVVDDLLLPVSACGRGLPIAEGLLVDEVDRGWPPPLIRCTIVDYDVDDKSFRMTVSAITSAHLIIVAAIDATVVIGVACGVIAWRRRRSARLVAQTGTAAT
jgi:hypothetical protein